MAASRASGQWSPAHTLQHMTRRTHQLTDLTDFPCSLTFQWGGRLLSLPLSSVTKSMTLHKTQGAGAGRTRQGPAGLQRHRCKAAYLNHCSIPPASEQTDWGMQRTIWEAPSTGSNSGLRLLVCCWLMR